MNKKKVCDFHKERGQDELCLKGPGKAKKKYVTRRRTPKEVAAQEAKDKEFRFGFALGLILLAQTYGADGQIDEIILYTLNDAGYDVSNFNDIDFDPKDRETLNRIFGV